MILPNWQAILNKTETQIRTPVRDCEFASGGRGGGRQEIFAIWHDWKNRRLHTDHQQLGFVRAPLTTLEVLYKLRYHRAMAWAENKTYAIQPAFGKKAVGRFRILRIERDDDEWVFDIEVVDDLTKPSK